MKMRHANSPELAGSANDTWRTWLMTGVRRNGVDRRRVRGAHLGIKKMLVEGMQVRSDKPYTWKDFSDAMVRQSVGEAMRELPRRDSELVKLAYFGGMSNRELADHMRMPEGTVERRLRRALDTISRYIERRSSSLRPVADTSPAGWSPTGSSRSGWFGSADRVVVSVIAGARSVRSSPKLRPAQSRAQIRAHPRPPGTQVRRTRPTLPIRSRAKASAAAAVLMRRSRAISKISRRVR